MRGHPTRARGHVVRVRALTRSRAGASPRVVGWRSAAFPGRVPGRYILRPNHRDTVTWALTSSGFFTTSSAWMAIRASRPKVPWADLVWFSGHIPRAAFILWLAFRKRLDTQDRLFQPIPNINCLFCGMVLESHDHLFFSYSASAQVWDFILCRLDIHVPQLPWEELIMWLATHWRGTSFEVVVRKLCLAATVYHIWQERNSHFPTNSRRRTMEEVLAAINMVRGKLTSFRAVEDSIRNRYIQVKWGLPTSIFRDL